MAWRNIVPPNMPRRMLLVLGVVVLLALATSTLALANIARPPATHLPRTHALSSQTVSGQARTSHTGTATLQSTASQSTQGAGRVPPGLPTHFSFGIMDGPGDTPVLDSMRSTNGTAWDYRYQYLAGGVNTGAGWSTWNQPAGAFARYYLQDSAAHGYLPTFVYYNLLQSTGPAGAGGSEPATDLAHLASPATMRAYYADWALLMQQLGTFGKPALVIVEPDLWGFIEQAAVRAGTTSAARVPASVASSGAADAAGFANTAQGFAYALLHIRDRYAPNAVLALHASAWGTGIDIASDTRTTLDAAAIGTQTADFLKTAGLGGTPAGVSPFDVLSNDLADHDAGQSGSWWDRTNVTFPNFSRYLQYTAALSAQTGRHLLLWQVPVGNQYFETENNSPGHTQDNKAEYILGHVPAFAKAGVIGVLFGPGNAGTAVQDAQHDGVTNPAPITTYECDRCNSHHSRYADDDGGYLRIFVGQYYRTGAYPLSGGA
jgi:hypothetical protein